MKKGRGWRNESQRHRMSAYGVKTANQPMKASGLDDKIMLEEMRTTHEHMENIQSSYDDEFGDDESLDFYRGVNALGEVIDRQGDLKSSGKIKVGKNSYWSDATQDIIDNGLESKLGYDYNKYINNEYSNKQMNRFYKKAIKSEELWKDFSEEFKKEFERNPTRKEYIYHIRFNMNKKNRRENK